MQADTADRLIAALSTAGLLVMSGCAMFEQGGSVYGSPTNQIRMNQYAAPIGCTRNEIKTRLWLTTPKEAERFCGRDAMGCYRPAWMVGGEFDLIVSAMPKDWNDKLALSVIGHELIHACGGTHE